MFLKNDSAVRKKIGYITLNYGDNSVKIDSHHLIDCLNETLRCEHNSSALGIY